MPPSNSKRAESFIIPAMNFIPLATGVPDATIVCPEGTRGLLIGSAGPLNCTINGEAKTALPVQAGIIAGFFETLEDSVGLTDPAENIWAIL